MYFASRVQAGRMLAAKLVDKYRYENCAVVALLNSAQIHLPLEPKAIAGITGEGSIAYNPQYAKGELDEMLSENRNYFEAEKLLQMHKLNQLVSGRGTIDKRLLKGHNIILVSDGLKSPFEIDLAYEFLKPVNIEKLIFAVPFAAIHAVDRMHVLGNELYCLNVLEDFDNNDHYYEIQDVPSHEKVLKAIETIVLNWK
jgi:predicted phosphoribosyltransferase